MFPDRPVAVIWDFDKTLIPGSMQKPLFEHFGVDGAQFWKEADGLPDFYGQQNLRASDNTLYLGHVLSYVRAGKFKGLSNKLLRELGSELDFYEGLPDFFASTKAAIEETPIFHELGIKLEHYVVSTGFRQMILGSAIAEFVTDVWACEFAETVAGPGYLVASENGEQERPELEAGGEITEIIYTIDNTAKTRAVFEINKGVNVDPRIDVNAKIAYEDRRVPFENMIYVADGPSDVPVFSIVKRFGGQTLGVYKPGDVKEFAQVERLARQGRINAFAPADYGESEEAALWISNAATRAALRMVEDEAQARERGLSERVGIAPGHIPAEPERSTGELHRD